MMDPQHRSKATGRRRTPAPEPRTPIDTLHTPRARYYSRKRIPPPSPSSSRRSTKKRPSASASERSRECLPIEGEIIIADSSDDRTAAIAQDLGATVVRPEKRGSRAPGGGISSWGTRTTPTTSWRSPNSSPGSMPAPTWPSAPGSGARSSPERCPPGRPAAGLDVCGCGGRRRRRPCRALRRGLCNLPVSHRRSRLPAGDDGRGLPLLHRPHRRRPACRGLLGGDLPRGRERRDDRFRRAPGVPGQKPLGLAPLPDGGGDAAGRDEDPHIRTLAGARPSRYARIRALPIPEPPP